MLNKDTTELYHKTVAHQILHTEVCKYTPTITLQKCTIHFHERAHFDGFWFQGENYQRHSSIYFETHQDNVRLPIFDARLLVPMDSGSPLVSVTEPEQVPTRNLIRIRYPSPNVSSSNTHIQNRFPRKSDLRSIQGKPWALQSVKNPNAQTSIVITVHHN